MDLLSLAISADHAVGIGLATVTAVTFAIYYLCVRLGTDEGHVLDVVFVSLLVNVVIIVPIVAIVHGIPSLSMASILAFVAAGVSGSLIARLVIATSVEAIGASRTSPIVASNVFFASLLAIFLFDEQLTALHLIGVVAIVTGVAVISWETARDAHVDTSLREVGISLVLPVVGAIFLGFEPIFVIVGLDAGGAILPGVAIKAFAATIGFYLYLVVSGMDRTDMLRWGANSKYYIGAGVTSSVGIIAYFGALQSAPVVIVVPLIQTSPLLVVVMSAVFLPRRLERVTLRLVLGSIVVVIGAVLVAVFG